MGKNPFGDDRGGPPKANPFGESEADISVAEAATRVEHAARKIRNLRSQLPATRELIDEIAKALEASASALRQLG
jgi:hypothetical protein